MHPKYWQRRKIIRINVNRLEEITYCIHCWFVLNKIRKNKYIFWEQWTDDSIVVLAFSEFSERMKCETFWWLHFNMHRFELAQLCIQWFSCLWAPNYWLESKFQKACNLFIICNCEKRMEFLSHILWNLKLICLSAIDIRCWNETKVSFKSIFCYLVDSCKNHWQLHWVYF